MARRLYRQGPAQVVVINDVFPSRSMPLAKGVGDNADGLLNRGLARRDFGHPLLGVLCPRAHDLDVFRTVSLHKICAGNHGLRIQCAHHWIVDCRTADHVNGGLRLAIRVRQRGRANKNDNRIHDGPRL
jgi:hypothetical protein